MGPGGAGRRLAAVAARPRADAVRDGRPAGLARRSAGRPDAVARGAAQRRGDHGVRGDVGGGPACVAAAAAIAATPGGDPGRVVAGVPRVDRAHRAALGRGAYRLELVSWLDP